MRDNRGPPDSRGPPSRMDSMRERPSYGGSMPAGGAGGYRDPYSSRDAPPPRRDFEDRDTGYGATSSYETRDFPSRSYDAPVSRDPYSDRGDSFNDRDRYSSNGPRESRYGSGPDSRDGYVTASYRNGDSGRDHAPSSYDAPRSRDYDVGSPREYGSSRGPPMSRPSSSPPRSGPRGGPMSFRDDRGKRDMDMRRGPPMRGEDMRGGEPPMKRPRSDYDGPSMSRGRPMRGGGSGGMSRGGSSFRGSPRGGSGSSMRGGSFRGGRGSFRGGDRPMRGGGGPPRRV